MTPLQATLSPVLLLLLGSCAAAPDSVERTPATPAPAAVQEHLRVGLSDVAGVHYDLASATREGKGVVLVFWQSWCVPCRREAPALVKAFGEYGDQLAFYGIVSGPDESVDEDRLTRTISELGLTYPTLRDREMGLTQTLKVNKTPTIIVFDQQLNITYRSNHVPPDWTALISAMAP